MSDDPPAPVRTAVEAEVARLPEQVRSSPLAAAALLLADRLVEASPREAAGVARELRMTLADLRLVAAAAPKEADPVDELAERRRSRRSGTAAASARAAGGDQRG